MNIIGRVLAVLLLVALGLGIGVMWAGSQVAEKARLAIEGTSPEALAQASLASVQAQNRQITFLARFVADITSTSRRLGMTSSKTLIVPGTVLYAIDWNEVSKEDIRWLEAERTLVVRIPPPEIASVDIDLGRIREYGDINLLLSLTDAEKILDKSNRAHVRSAILAQAREPSVMALARESSRRAAQALFALPLEASGRAVDVIIRFKDEPDTPM